MKFLNTILLISVFYSLGYCDYDKREDKLKQVYYYKLFIEKLESNFINNNSAISSLQEKSRELSDKINILSKLLEGNPDNGKDLLNHQIEFINRKQKIDNLKEEYKKRILWLYKKGPEYQYQLIFLAESPLNFYSRIQYLTRLAQNRKKELEKIKFEEYNLAEQKKIQSINRNEIKVYLQKKRSDKELLLKDKMDTEDSLNFLQRDNEIIQRQIAKIKDRISTLEYYLSEYKSNIIYHTANNIDYMNLSFENCIGKFILPVNSVDIINDFGKSVNPLTGTVTFNNGIDVSIAENSEVKCIYDGIVYSIDDLPYLGKTIIIKHTGDYYTIYSILKNIKVTENEKVNAGEIIAYTSKTIDEQRFHFEVRKEFSALDPKSLFRRGVVDFIE